MLKTNDKGKKCLKLTESTVRTFPFNCTKICLKISYFSFKKMRSVMYQNVSLHTCTLQRFRLLKIFPNQEVNGISYKIKKKSERKKTNKHFAAFKKLHKPL